MSYELGIDLGTTYTAAATHRSGRVEVVTLGDRAPVIPSAIFLKEDESILTGDAAARRGVTEPRRVAREFKRRMGDPAPVLVGGTPYSPEALMAKLLRWTLHAVEEREGGAPASVTVTHPANWGPYKRELLDQAIQLAEIDAAVSTLTEPEAAAVYYASHERVETGSIVAVYDLGGGTFDAAVLEKIDSGWEIRGEPEGIEHLGGVDFDEAVFQHVNEALDGKVEELDPDDEAVTAAVARLREECVQAKEALSRDTDASIPILLPDVSTEIRLTRTEFETMIRPTLHQTVESLHRALRTAEVAPGDVTAVLLVGGSSRIPLVAQLVAAELERPVAVDTHPKHAIALGAAIAAAQAHDQIPAAVAVDAGTDAIQPAAAVVGAAGAAGAAGAMAAGSPAHASTGGSEDSGGSNSQPGAGGAESGPGGSAGDDQGGAGGGDGGGDGDGPPRSLNPDGGGDDGDRPWWQRTGTLIGAVLAAIVLIGGGALALSGGGNDESTPTSTTSSTTSSTTTSTPTPAGGSSGDGGQVGTGAGTGGTGGGDTGGPAPTTDTDGDGVYDSDDNCSETYNPDQYDGDGDGYGDVCDDEDEGTTDDTGDTGDTGDGYEDGEPTDEGEDGDTAGDTGGDTGDYVPPEDDGSPPS